MRVIFVIIGTIIGAGFASGQEIYSFFARHGTYGFLGIILSSTLISLVIRKILRVIKENNVNNYESFLENVLGQKFFENKTVKGIIINSVNIFLLISFFIMVSGFSTYFYQELYLPKIIGWILVFFLLLLTFSKNISGIIKVNNYLVPVLIVLFVVLGSKKIELSNFLNIKKINLLYFDYNWKWIVSSILYASYNSIILVPILISLRKYISNEKKISAISGTIILILALTIYLILFSNIDNINGIEIPIVHIAGSLGSIYKFIYGIVILIAIFTSAVSAGYGFLVNISKDKKTYKKFCFLILFSSLFVSYIGFRNLVNLLYPLFGIFGLAQIFFLLKT